MPDKFEVSADWMKACGKGEEAKVYDVNRTWMAGNLPFVELIETNSLWVVCAAWRGQFI